MNSRGERFADESFYRSYVGALSHFDGQKQRFPNWPAWWVFDQAYRDTYAIGPLEPGTPLPDGFALSAETLEDLAAQAGFDSSGFVRSVSRYNGYARVGVDKDFSRGSMQWSRVMWGDARVKPNPNLGPIDTPPFYAVALHRVGTGLVTAGLKTRSNAQVLDARDRPLRGLYALGNSSVRSEMGAGYNSGLAIGRSLIFAVLAADDAIRRKPT